MLFSRFIKSEIYDLHKSLKLLFSIQILSLITYFMYDEKIKMIIYATFNYDKLHRLINLDVLIHLAIIPKMLNSPLFMN